jgi:hypothetical protein
MKKNPSADSTEHIFTNALLYTHPHISCLRSFLILAVLNSELFIIHKIATLNVIVIRKMPLLWVSPFYNDLYTF